MADLTPEQIFERANSTWDEIVDGYFLSDIENLRAIQLQPGKTVGLAGVGQFLSVASFLELLGKALYDGEDLLYYSNQDKAWKYYFDNYLTDYKDIYDPIFNLIRNGSAHLFLPREVGLSKRDGEKLWFYEGDLPVFNVTTFTNIFVDSLPAVKKSILDDIEVAERFLKRYSRIQVENQTKFVKGKYDEIIKEFIKNYPDDTKSNNAVLPKNITVHIEPELPNNMATPSTTRPVSLMNEPLPENVKSSTTSSRFINLD